MYNRKYKENVIWKKKVWFKGKKKVKKEVWMHSRIKYDWSVLSEFLNIC